MYPTFQWALGGRLVHHLNSALLTFKELTTATGQIEAIMNSRPLYSILSNAKDLEITPGHFLLAVQQAFWKRWSKEYLTLLPVTNLTTGTLALIAEDNTHLNQWLVGRVVEVFPGGDGLIRTVSLRTASRELNFSH